MFSFSFDENTGILICRVVGAWTNVDTEQFEREAAIEYPKVRAKVGCLRLLIDRVEADLMQQEVIERLTQAGRRVGRAGDRAATVVSTSLAKLQTKRVMPPGLDSVFLSRQAAITWLKAHDHSKGVGGPSKPAP